MGSPKKKTILIVDDDIFLSNILSTELRSEGINVIFSRTLGDAQKIIKSGEIDTVILDVMFEIGNNHTLDDEEILSTKDGFESGRVLANWIKNNHPKVSFIAYSHDDNQNNIEWFQNHGGGFVSKRETPREFVKFNFALKKKKKKLKIFIVHGHDEILLLGLKNFVQNSLHFPEPIVLREKPNSGRTIIEKFEEEANDTDLVFVLLTPDDVGYKAGTDDEKRRSRQNVIFEMGYFLGKLGRRENNKRIILLYIGENELPSDISGIGYIDISNGIEAAGENIRREVDHFLKKP